MNDLIPKNVGIELGLNDVVQVTIPDDVNIPEYIQQHLDNQPDELEVDKYMASLFEDKLEVKIKPLVPLNQFCIPFKGSEGAACFDVKAVTITYIDTISGTDYEVVVQLGFCTEIPDGYKGLIVPRSSFTKTEWVMQNSPAQIDQDYRGEWTIKFKYIGRDIIPSFPINEGDRVAQIYFEKVQPVQFIIADELSETKRNTGSYGSTGQ